MADLKVEASFAEEQGFKSFVYKLPGDQTEYTSGSDNVSQLCQFTCTQTYALSLTHTHHTFNHVLSLSLHPHKHAHAHRDIMLSLFHTHWIGDGWRNGRGSDIVFLFTNHVCLLYVNCVIS